MIGDGAVGLLAVLSAKQLGRRADRADGPPRGVPTSAASSAPPTWSPSAARRASPRSATSPTAAARSCSRPSATCRRTSRRVGIVRPGGVISRVGVPQYEDAPVGFGSLFGPNVTLTGGPAPVRAYIEQLLPAVLDGTVEPGRVFDRTVGLDDTPGGYAAMDDREALKVMVRP